MKVNEGLKFSFPKAMVWENGRLHGIEEHGVDCGQQCYFCVLIDMKFQSIVYSCFITTLVAHLARVEKCMIN